jgi:hypothetical protein
MLMLPACHNGRKGHVLCCSPGERRGLVMFPYVVISVGVVLIALATSGIL